MVSHMSIDRFHEKWSCFVISNKAMCGLSHQVSQAFCERTPLCYQTTQFDAKKYWEWSASSCLPWSAACVVCDSYIQFNPDPKFSSHRWCNIIHAVCVHGVLCSNCESCSAWVCWCIIHMYRLAVIMLQKREHPSGCKHHRSYRDKSTVSTRFVLIYFLYQVW